MANLNGSNLRTGTCPRCWNTREIYQHHWLPKRFFGDTNKKLGICASCHREIERILNNTPKFSIEEYEAIHKAFMRGQALIVIKEGQDDTVYSEVGGMVLAFH